MVDNSERSLKSGGSWWVEGIREAYEQQHPERGGRPSLSHVEELKLLVMAGGAEGVRLAELDRSLGLLGREKKADALRSLRNDPAISESRERRPDRNGRLREQVVLRLR